MFRCCLLHLSIAVVVMLPGIPCCYAVALSAATEDWQIPPAQIIQPEANPPAPPTNKPPLAGPIPTPSKAPQYSPRPTSSQPHSPPAPEQPTLSPAEAHALFLENLALQIQLDRRHFSPGCLDGRWGRQSRQALAAWQTVNRLPPTGSPDPATRATLGDLQNLLVDYPVDPVDYVNLAPLPITWKEKSKVFSLGYETAQESIAEKFHLAQAALVRLNPTAPWPNPPVGTFLKVPDLRGKRPPFAARLEISLSNKWLRAYSTNNSLIAHFPCSIGADEARRPVGDLVILKAAVDPIYVFDPAVFPESPEARTLRGKLIIPGGPNNPVGVAWIGLNKPGYGIHGTPIPEDIGKTESHGCFRLANWNARKMVSMIVTGTPVRVKP